MVESQPILFSLPLRAFIFRLKNMFDIFFTAGMKQRKSSNVLQKSCKKPVGGVDFSTLAISKCFRNSRLNLLRLLPGLTELLVHDNSVEADPARGARPQPRRVLHMQRGRIIVGDDLGRTPEWAKPIVAAAVRLMS